MKQNWFQGESNVKIEINLNNEKYIHPPMNIQLDNLPETKKKAIREFVSSLKERYKDKIIRIILFGSMVRGDFLEESDIDILVIGEGINLLDISKLTSKILLEYGEVIVPIVRSENEFQKRKTYTFYRTILKEGVELA